MTTPVDQARSAAIGGRQTLDALHEPRPVLGTLAACAAVHLTAAAAVYRDLVRDLYHLFDATPRLLVLERGLARLMAAVVFLPPLVPTALLLFAAFWVGAARRERDVARWFVTASLVLAADGVLRAIGTVIAPAPATIGELLDLPARFSPGPRLAASLLALEPGPRTMYWLVVCSLPALATVYCVARAIVAAEECALDPGERKRRRLAGDSLATVQAIVVASGAFLAIALLGQLMLPALVQLFLRMLG